MNRRFWRLSVAMLVGISVFAVGQPAEANRVLRDGAVGASVRSLQNRLNDLSGHICGSFNAGECLAKYRVVVDGRFGVQTTEAVVMFQAQEGLFRDGVVGPQTWAALYAPQPRCESARKALVAGGATAAETDLGVRLANRETGCRLNLHVLKHSTGDDSYGPWMVNYYRSCCAGRETWLGAPWRNTVSWRSAVAMFLKFGRTAGWCHWRPKVYCSS